MKTPQISEAEWQVMHVIWEHQPVNSQEIVAHLADLQDWSPTTIKTMLFRLVKKKALSYEKQGNRYLYRAKVKKKDCIKQESQSFMDRVFGGDQLPMLSYFVNSGNLTQEQISELKKLLEEQDV
jgi:BlaI family transcriptional regulator, penicillinase repressor